MFNYLSKLLCGIFGPHQFIIKYERNGDLGIKRVYALCLKCGKETEGFDVG